MKRLGQHGGCAEKGLTDFLQGPAAPVVLWLRLRLRRRVSRFVSPCHLQYYRRHYILGDRSRGFIQSIYLRSRLRAASGLVFPARREVCRQAGSPACRRRVDESPTRLSGLNHRRQVRHGLFRASGMPVHRHRRGGSVSVSMGGSFLASAEEHLCLLFRVSVLQFGGLRAHRTTFLALARKNPCGHPGLSFWRPCRQLC